MSDTEWVVSGGVVGYRQLGKELLNFKFVSFQSLLLCHVWVKDNIWRLIVLVKWKRLEIIMYS